MEKKNFVHKMANVEGDVVLGNGVSVWPFASIRGDEGKITIGENSNIQDGAVVHGMTVIGANATVGHGAVIDSAKIGNNVLIGMNCTILDGVEIGDWNIIAAGTVVAPNTKIGNGNVVMGVPGKVVRLLSSKDKDLIEFACKNYLKKLNINKE